MREVPLGTEYAPNFRVSLLNYRLRTPIDLERETGLTDGSIWHVQHTAEQLFGNRPLDVRSRKQEQELLSRARDRFEEGVRRLVASLKLTPDQVETLWGQSAAWARRLTDPPRRQAVELLSRLGPSRWDRLMATGRVEIPFESLSPTDQERVRRYLEVSNEQRDRDDEAGDTPGGPTSGT